jgi:hypothetical protein
MRLTQSLCFCAALILAGCATPVGYSNKPMQTADKDTEYRIDSTEDGFSITVYYSRYQFIPESDALVDACKSALTSTAYDHADKVNRKIEPINEQRIKLSMGRNGLTGITSCSAIAPVKWTVN